MESGVLLPLPNLRPSSSNSFCLFSSFFQLQSKLQDHPTQLLIDLVRPFEERLLKNSWKRSRSLNSVIAKRREKIAPFPRWKSLKLFPDFSQTPAPCGAHHTRLEARKTRGIAFLGAPLPPGFVSVAAKGVPFALQDAPGSLELFRLTLDKRRTGEAESALGTPLEAHVV